MHRFYQPDAAAGVIKRLSLFVQLRSIYEQELRAAVTGSDLARRVGIFVEMNVAPRHGFEPFAENSFDHMLGCTVVESRGWGAGTEVEVHGYCVSVVCPNQGPAFVKGKARFPAFMYNSFEFVAVDGHTLVRHGHKELVYGDPPALENANAESIGAMAQMFRKVFAYPDTPPLIHG